MSSEIFNNLFEYDSPNIQVVWEDTSDNISQERLKRVKQYFQKKYNTNNVNIITKTKTHEDDEVMQTIDVSHNIMDHNYQKSLIDMFIDSKSYNDFAAQIYLLDKQVNDIILNSSNENVAFNRWYIKRIEFSNFMSFGQNQVLDLEKYDGITVVTSDPPNFGGKTVLTVDLILFLFFNTTTKTNKSEDIFNKYTDEDKVTVKGLINIDGNDYYIIRTLERKKNKSGDFTVKNDLDFVKVSSTGEHINFTGEQRRETEKIIKSSIGEQDDFLMTILTTGNNLEDLVQSKPTARGQVISRFLGLEFIKKKEEVCKEIYSTFAKSMISNVYNIEKLRQDIVTNEQIISDKRDENSRLKNELIEVSEKITVGFKYRDDLNASKHTDIDKELANININQVNDTVNKYDNDIFSTKKLLSEINLNKPDEIYDEVAYDKIVDQYNTELVNLKTLTAKIEDIEQYKNSVSGGIKCDSCGIELINAVLVKAKLDELDTLAARKLESESLIEMLKEKKTSYSALKSKFDEYEKNLLIASKLEITLESLQLKKQEAEDKLKRYQDQVDKINKNNQIESQLLKAKIRLDELQSKKSQIESSIAKNDFNINNLFDKIEHDNSLIFKINEEFDRERVYKIYLEIFGKNGISKYIIKTMLPIINNELQRLLEDSAYFRVEIKISEKNDVEFWMHDTTSGVEKLLSSGSGYEITIASLAIRSVLSKVCSLPKPNIIIMDEVFGKISNDNLDMVGAFFGKIKNYFEKIFVISHNPLIDNWADNLIKIKKTNNVSEIY